MDTHTTTLFSTVLLTVHTLLGFFTGTIVVYLTFFYKKTVILSAPSSKHLHQIQNSKSGNYTQISCLSFVYNLKILDKNNPPTINNDDNLFVSKFI